MHLFYVCYEDLTREAAWTVHIREVVNSWGELGRQVTLFAPRIWPFTVSPRCEVVYIPTVNVRFVREYLYLLILPLYILVFGLRRRPAAVYCREMTLMAPIVCAARLIGAPVIMEVNGFLLRDLAMIGAPRMKLVVFRLLQRISLGLADRLVFVGRDYLGLFQKEYGIDEQKVRFVPNGVDTDLFSPGERTEAIEGLGLDPKRRYVTFVGSFHPHSLAPTIVRAAEEVAEQYPDVDFIMVGDGHDLPSCREIAGEMGVSDRIIFTGMINNREIPRYLNASEVLINLIADSTENSSMKLLEYMSVGGAVISNGVSAFGVTLLDRRDCLHLDEATPEGLARAIKELISDESLRTIIGKRARALVLENFSWERTAERLLDVIDEAREKR